MSNKSNKNTKNVGKNQTYKLVKKVKDWPYSSFHKFIE